MAARKVGQKAVNWEAFAERIPASHKTKFSVLKSKSDALKARLNSLPEQPAAIKWDVYKQKVPVAGLVDNFQKQFATVKVPYPLDSETSKIDAKEKEMTESVKSLVEESNQRIAEYKVQLENLSNMIPLEEMTVEEYNQAFPVPLDKGTEYWPYFNFREESK